MGMFYLTAICCEEKAYAELFQLKYSGQTFYFNHDDGSARLGGICSLSVTVQEGDHEMWWANIFPCGITNSGILSWDEARRADQYDSVIYGMLRNDFWFSFAITGVECDNFRSKDELIEEMKSRDKVLHDMPGLIVSQEIYDLYPMDKFHNNINGYLETPFAIFNKTHFWIPKEHGNILSSEFGCAEDDL